MKKVDSQKAAFSWYNIVSPIVIGLGVMAWLFADQFKDFDRHAVVFTPRAWLGIFLAFLFFLGREVGYVCRYHIVSNGSLTWSQSFKVCMLCEFSSAITPSSVGGSSISMLFMRRSGISLGRGTTFMLITILYDSLFYVVSIPIVLMFSSWNELIAPLKMTPYVNVGTLLWVLYAVISLWCVVLFVGIVLRPGWIKTMMHALASWRPLQRWSAPLEEFGDNIIAASQEVKGHGLSWWLKGFGVTVFSWVSRYLIVNALIFAFVPGVNQWLVFAMQRIVWMVLIVCPTPGGSGVGEWLFKSYYAAFIPTASLALVIALLWRWFSYYIFLAIGAAVIPSWLRGDSRS